MKKTSKFLIPSSILILGSATTMFADNNDSCPPRCKSECPCPTTKPKPSPKEECPSCGGCGSCDWCCAENRTCNTCPPRREINPPAGPCVMCGADVFVTAEFIYWTAREDNLGFITSSGVVVNNASATTSRGRVHHPDWRFRPGFKVGIGMNFDCDGWDLYANYTWFRMRNTKETERPSTTKVLQDVNWNINGFEIRNNTTNNITFAQGKWDLDFNVIDLELGRNFYVSRCLMLRPHFGFKGTWQEQKYDTFYNATVVVTNTVNDITLATGNLFRNSMDAHNDYWGIGIRAGLDTAWHFTRSFSLYGEIAVTGLWERFEARRKDVTFNITTALNSVLMHTENNFHTIKPVIEWAIGLRWETWFCDDNYHFGIEAGWEEQFWGNQNQFFNTGDESRGGDLVLQGLTIKVRFDF